MFEPKAGMSNVWSGITENARYLCEGTKVTVGNGSSTLFCDHKWATDNPVIELAILPVPVEIAGATVEEMWEVDQGWKWDVFAPYLTQETLKLIQSHELKNDPDIADLMYWKAESKGKFTIRSVLSIMR